MTKRKEDDTRLKLRQVSMSDAMWDAVGDQSEAGGDSKSAVVRKAVDRYLATENAGHVPEDPDATAVRDIIRTARSVRCLCDTLRIERGSSGSGHFDDCYVPELAAALARLDESRAAKVDA